jgi:hypothetical protein
MPTPADLRTDSESSATVGLADSAIRLDRDPCGSEVFDLLHRRTQGRPRCARGLVDDAAGQIPVEDFNQALLGIPARTP